MSRIKLPSLSGKMMLLRNVAMFLVVSLPIMAAPSPGDLPDGVAPSSNEAKCLRIWMSEAEEPFKVESILDTKIVQGGSQERTISQLKVVATLVGGKGTKYSFVCALREDGSVDGPKTYGSIKLFKLIGKGSGKN